MVQRNFFSEKKKFNENGNANFFWYYRTCEYLNFNKYQILSEFFCRN